jgi:hypothetical protein
VELLTVASASVTSRLAPRGEPHLAPLLAIANLRRLEWFHDHVRIESMLFDGYPAPDGGTIRPSETPGHGMTWRPAAAATYQVR